MERIHGREVNFFINSSRVFAPTIILSLERNHWWGKEPFFVARTSFISLSEKMTKMNYIEKNVTWASKMSNKPTFLALSRSSETELAWARSTSAILAFCESGQLWWVLMHSNFLFLALYIFFLPSHLHYSLETWN